MREIEKLREHLTMITYKLIVKVIYIYTCISYCPARVQHAIYCTRAI